MRKLLALSALLVLLDQGTKLAVKGFNLFGFRHEGMYLGESFSVIGDFLRFTFVENPGMAFGLNFGLPLLLGLFSIGAAIFLVYLLYKSRHGKITGFHIALAMILGGAVGNLIDRVFYGVFYGYAPLFEGKVVDFVDVNIPDISLFGHTWDRFYIFNVADAAVTVGIVLLLIFYPRHQKKTEQGNNREGVAAGTDPVIYTTGIGEGTQTPAEGGSGAAGKSYQADPSHSSHTQPPEFSSDSSAVSGHDGGDGGLDGGDI